MVNARLKPLRRATPCLRSPCVRWTNRFVPARRLHDRLCRRELQAYDKEVTWKCYFELAVNRQQIHGTLDHVVLVIWRCRAVVDGGLCVRIAAESISKLATSGRCELATPGGLPSKRNVHTDIPVISCWWLSSERHWPQLQNGLIYRTWHSLEPFSDLT